MFILLYIHITSVISGGSRVHTALHPALCVFFQVIVVFILLYIQLGYSALISASLVLFLCPFQYFVGKKLAQVQKETLVSTRSLVTSMESNVGHMAGYPLHRENRENSQTNSLQGKLRIWKFCQNTGNSDC